jgi:hypothetical protein
VSGKLAVRGRDRGTSRPVGASVGIVGDRSECLDGPLRRVGQQLVYSGEALAALQAATAEVGEIRRSALDSLRARGMTLAQISAEAGVSIARLSQLGASKRRPERALLSPGQVVRVVLPVEEAAYPEGSTRPAVHESDLGFRDDIATLASQFALETEPEYLPNGEYVDLNREASW